MIMKTKHSGKYCEPRPGEEHGTIWKDPEPTTELSLVCPCGKTLIVAVPSNGWLNHVAAVAKANDWHIDRWGERTGDIVPAFCDHCREK